MVSGPDDPNDRGARRGPDIARTKPWQGARPGSAMRLGSVDELLTLVTFDVPCDRTRKRAGDVCKDYGLLREQWSVFEGSMTRNRREELWGRLVALLAEAPGGGKLAMYPIGAREAVWAQREIIAGTKAAAGGGDEG
jgi:CRISPR-associated protein Cas2